MALGITVSKTNPAVNETYTITVSPPSGDNYFYFNIVIIYESSDGGMTWNSVQRWDNAGGQPSLTYSTSKATAGSYQYQAKEYMHDYTNNVDVLQDQSGVLTVTVGGTQTTSLSLSCIPNPVIADPYNINEVPTTATATLTSGGSALSGKTINFYVREGSPTGTTLYQTSATTDTNGQASIQLTPSLWQGTDYDPYIVAEFPGDATYSPSTANAQVIWYKVSGTLSLSAPPSIPAGVQFQLTAQLLPSAQEQVDGKTIELWRDGVKVATSTTAYQGGQSGIAYFYQTLQQGTYTFQAKFQGEPGHIAPCQSSQIQVQATGTGSLSLTATPGSAQITYDWSKYEGANFHHYRLKIGTSSGGSDIANLTFTNVNTTSYVKTGLTNGVTYYATVYAEDSNNQVLAQSQEVSATPQATTYTEILGTATSQKISLTRAVSGQIISASTWNTDEQTIENFTGKVFIGSVSIPANIKDVKVNLPSGVPSAFKVIGILESPVPTAVSIEEITSTSFKLHLASALPYSTTFHYILWALD